LDVNLIAAVDEDVRDGGVFEENFQRTKAEDFVENIARQAFPFGKAQGNGFRSNLVADDGQHLPVNGFRSSAAQLFQIQTVKDLLVEVCLYLLEAILRKRRVLVCHDCVLTARRSLAPNGQRLPWLGWAPDVTVRARSAKQRARSELLCLTIGTPRS